MSKIPIGQVIGQTFDLSFRQYFTLLGIVLLPVLLMGVAGYFLVLPFAQEFFEFLRYAMAHPEYHRLPLGLGNGMFQRMWLFDGLIMPLFVMIGVGIVKEVLGERTGPRFVYAGFGAAEMRTIAGYSIVLMLLYAAILAVIVIGAGIAVAVAFAAGAALQGANPGIVGWPLASFIALLVFGLELAAIYISVRLSYLIVPVAVAEKRIGIARSWEMTRGNFWRIIGIWMITLLPLFIIQMVFMAAVFAPSMKLLIAAAQQGNAALSDQLRVLMQTYLQYLPLTWLIGFLLAPVLCGLWMAPAAFAYRALVSVPPTAPDEPQATAGFP